MVGAENRAAVHARARQLIRALTLLAYGVAALASVSLALSRFGLSEPRWDPREVARWSATHGINVVIIAAGAFIVIRAANLVVEHLQFKLTRSHATTDLEWQRRAATLGGILTSLMTAVVGFVAVLMLLRELSIDIVPILTGAGIAGLAIGFGAQNLVRDVISGFFLILEDQVRIGDLARINGVAGTVEQINLRTIILRDGEGAVQLVDGTSELFRHYYAMPRARDREGREVAAVRGVLLSVLGMINGGATHIGVATDHVIESFRNRLWPAYKTGDGIDPDLLDQFQLLEDALVDLGVAAWPMIEYEVDDALAAAAAGAGPYPLARRVAIC